MKNSANRIFKRFYVRDNNILRNLNLYVIFIIVLLIFALLLFKIHQDSHYKSKTELIFLADGFAKRIEFILHGNQDYIELIASERAEGKLNENSFHSRVQPFLNDHPEFINITWVDSSYTIRTVAPLKGNQHITGLPIELPEPRNAAVSAKEKRKSTYTIPFEAIQSESSFEIWVPVFDHDKFLGFFAGVYSCNTLVRVARQNISSGNDVLYLKDRKGTILASSGDTGKKGESAEVSLDPPGNGMSLLVNAETTHKADWAMLLFILLSFASIFSIVFFLIKIKKQNQLKYEIEKMLRKERNFLNMIMETIPSGIMMIDKNGSIVYANKKAEEILEFSINMNSSKQYNSSDFQITDLNGEILADEMLPFSIVKRTMSPVNDIQHAIALQSDERKVLSINAAPIVTPDGEFDGMVASIDDITNRQKAEQVRHESEQIFNSFFEQESVGVVIINSKTGKILKANRKICSILGYSEEEIRNFNYLDVTFPEDLEESKKFVEALYHRDISEFSIEKRYVRKDGQLVWTNITVFPMRDTVGTSDHNVAIIQDITERKRSEAILKTKDELIRMTGEIAKVGGWEFDPDTGEGTWTDEVAIIHDLDPSQETNVSLGVSFYTPSSRKKIEEAIQEVLQKRKPYDLELELVSAKGVKKWVRTVGFPVIDKHDKIVKVRGIFQDITERKNFEEDLIKTREKALESDRLKTVFLQNMSHEIRTPMNAIMGFSDLLKHNLGNEQKLLHFAQIIQQRSADLLALISDILDLSKIDSGQLPINMEETNIEVFFNELLGIFKFQREKLNKNHIDIVLNPASDLKEKVVQVDRQKLKQIFINLVNNSLKFTNQGKIEFGYYTDPDKNMVFYVSDTGIGIPADKQSYIFERFAQLKQDQTIYSGTGLGLSIVKGLTELMGGRIWLDSEPGRGSTFYFTVHHSPLLKKEPRKIYKIPSGVINLKDKKVLIVEDDEFNMEYIQEVLSGTGVNILTARTGHEALEIAGKVPDIGIVLMDINLPEMDGFEATVKIKKMCPGIKVIAQTAYATVSDKEKSYESGCVDFLSKPIKKEVLLEKIREHLGG